MQMIYTTISIDQAIACRLTTGKCARRGVKTLCAEAIAKASSRRISQTVQRAVRYQKISSLKRIHLAIPADNYEILCNLRCSCKISVSAMICAALAELLNDINSGKKLKLDSYPKFSFTAQHQQDANRTILTLWWEKQKKPPRRAASS